MGDSEMSDVVPSSGGQPDVETEIHEDNLEATTPGRGGFLGGLFNRKGGQNARKTVTFGDASAVRSKPLWSLISLLLIVGFWWLSTAAWGFPDDYKQVVDDQFTAAVEDARERNQERIESGNPNLVAEPAASPLERDYLTSCRNIFDATRIQAEDEQGAAIEERLRSDERVTSRASTPEELDEIVLASKEASLTKIAEDQSPCNINAVSQWVNPRTLPSPKDTFTQFIRLSTDGFQGTRLHEQAFTSLWRVMRGMFWGSLIGIPIGMAMGLSSRLRGFFDTPVEGFRPIPPLAILPLFILWFGIGDGTAVKLLIFASVWIMIIAARAGTRTVQLSKVRAAYALGASKPQVLGRVILPNALPELFTGLRVALGVSWGTLVAAELVGADTGLGAMIFLARNFLRTDVVVVGIIVIAVIGVAMDILMRIIESILIPWRGKG